jgi:hypothetical protein
VKTRLIWDRAAMELVDPVEYARRQEAREPHDAFVVVRAAERGSWVWDAVKGELVEAHAHRAARPRGQRSHLAAPAIHGDFSDYVMCHADGVRYGSKGEYRAALRRNGCVEVGNEALHERTDPEPKVDRQDVVNDIKRAMSEHGVAV